MQKTKVWTGNPLNCFLSKNWFHFCDQQHRFSLPSKFHWNMKTFFLQFFSWGVRWFWTFKSQILLSNQIFFNLSRMLLQVILDRESESDFRFWIFMLYLAYIEIGFFKVSFFEQIKNFLPKIANFVANFL
jgi:hypothetical protein